MLRQVRHISDLAQIAYVRQKEQLGLGHAVLMAKELVGHEPFAVILSDDVVVGERPCIGQLIHAYHQTHASVVAVTEVPREETGRYGVIDGEPAGHDATTTSGSTGSTGSSRSRPRHDAPSNLAIIGRYVLTPKIFDKLEQTPRGAGGEIQLTDAIEALMEEQDVYRLRVRGHALRRRHDDGLAEGVGRAGARSGRTSAPSSAATCATLRSGAGAPDRRARIVPGVEAHPGRRPIRYDARRMTGAAAR